MKTWLDLEGRFRALEPQLRNARLSGQWGAAGDHWHIAGLVDSMARQEFELLSGVAGRWLEKVLSTKNETDRELLDIPDPKIRWYVLLKRSSPAWKTDLYGEQRADDGSPLGIIYGGTMSSVAAASANQCLALQASHPLREEVSKWKWIHDNYIKGLVVGAILALVGAAAKLLFG
ncbi:hypothetical protein [Aquipseudomonas alcaligenes]|uniref:hypothetical protein n=1 Tax=Aquipseudomonas alcaligenes TaxID=43263 RepID=UPI0012E7B4A2|nr:hypothetical protein [Pseudomonas alcaligenes]